MSKLHLQVNQYTQFGRRSRALFREIMLAVCEGLVEEKKKYCPKCRHEVSFWQLSLGTLADAYTLWLLSPIQWHDDNRGHLTKRKKSYAKAECRCSKLRCKIAHALRNAVAHSEDAGEKFPWVPGVEELRPGGLWYFKVKLDDSFPRMHSPKRDEVIRWTRELYGGDEIDLVDVAREKIKCVEDNIPDGVREKFPDPIYWPQGIQLGGPPVV